MKAPELIDERIKELGLGKNVQDLVKCRLLANELYKQGILDCRERLDNKYKDRILYLNSKYGVDFKTRVGKLHEEFVELFETLSIPDKKEATEKFLDELSDVTIVLTHVASLFGYTLSNLLHMAQTKIEMREIEPTFMRGTKQLKN